MDKQRREKAWRERLAAIDASKAPVLSKREEAKLQRKAETFANGGDIGNFVASLVWSQKQNFERAITNLDDRDLCNLYVRLLKLALDARASAEPETAKSNIMNLVNNLSIQLLSEK